MINFIYCFVCGYNTAEDADFSDSSRGVSICTFKFYMCPCCGFHYGIDDDMYKLMEYRQDWINQGMPFGSELEHPNWTITTVIKQFKNLVNCDFSIFSKTSENWEYMIKKQNIDWTSDFEEDIIRENWFVHRRK